jgi:hypothetical protein
VIIPGSEMRKIPTQLEDFSAPEVCTYSLESTTAEKLDAMVSRLELTSRMKDFYDIWYLSHTFAFDGAVLLEAVKNTLANCGTSWTRGTFDAILSFADNRDMLSKWRFFLRRPGLEALDFKTVLDGIGAFLSPVWKALADGAALHASWDPLSGAWSSVDREG